MSANQIVIGLPSISWSYNLTISQFWFEIPIFGNAEHPFNGLAFDEDIQCNDHELHHYLALSTLHSAIIAGNSILANKSSEVIRWLPRCHPSDCMGIITAQNLRSGREVLVMTENALDLSVCSVAFQRQIRPHFHHRMLRSSDMFAPSVLNHSFSSDQSIEFCSMRCNADTRVEHPFAVFLFLFLFLAHSLGSLNRGLWNRAS
jgi:hypothetical protein